MFSHSAQTRGYADHGWLKSHHTFSFAGYYNPERMGFGALRVINDDRIDGGTGFGTHPHANMEIISIPLTGSLRHRDSEGNSYVIKRGEVQIMSAGTGIAHSEYNASEKEETNFLQIWVMPKKMDIEPRYEQKEIPQGQGLNLIVSPHGEGGSVSINQDAWFSMGHLEANSTVNYEKRLNTNGVYVFVISGSLEVNGVKLNERDGLGIDEGTSLKLTAGGKTDVLLMEVPMYRSVS
jgi:redox-sensitive bicupin YhaK (pirin superfamily)